MKKKFLAKFTVKINCHFKSLCADEKKTISNHEVHLPLHLFYRRHLEAQVANIYRYSF